MNATGSLWRWGLWPWIGLIVLLAASAAAASSARAADDAAAKPDSNLDIIQFKAPGGWKVDDRQAQGLRTFMSPDSDAAQQALIVVFISPPVERMDFRTMFDTTIKQMIGNGKVTDPGEVTSTKTRQGYEALAQTLTAQAPTGASFKARFVAANVQNRFACIYFVATTKELYSKHEEKMDALLGSVSFGAGGGGGGGNAMANAAAKAEFEALEKQKQELLKKLAEIDARQRQLVGGAAAGAPGAGNAGSGARDAELLAKAREQFAKDMAKRKKPHTVLGDILTLEGKPIPNVQRCRIYVRGTTVAAERTHYDIEVDDNGHYEMQIPDGVYKVQAVCTVKYSGRVVPVDLACVDEKRDGMDQTSANGIVSDYRLVLNGLKPGADPKGQSSYYGGTVTLDTGTFEPRDKLSARYPGTKIVMTLTPKGPLVDGSRREAMQFEVDVASIEFQARVQNIPMGEYTAQFAVVDSAGRTRALRCSKVFGGQYSNSVDLFWEGMEGVQELRAEPKIMVME